MQTRQRYYTPGEYLAQEEVAEFRSEYRSGEIVPMTGGSINHNQIAGNIYAVLKSALRTKDAKPYIGDLRVWIPRYQLYTYPDVLVIQGSPAFQSERTDTILNPCLIFEVLSKSTKNYDRTDKFRYYRSISELCEYILVDQYTVGIEQYTKSDDTTWLFRTIESNSSKIVLASVGLEISVSDIYEGVDFDLKEIEE
ncbi:Uma2 family endonuclease [Gloeobacter morelensis]|uniref:Uma2 family endonuclease n=1 Tax=Gloeobacter morelensis MG652769 TaxID=2781736 RepID=A0ABY3PI44_9CYAN|nr:Uma2 family endonuclease [Gloeobacter morelensis]UFP93289.1 Uma2 family endonuclease [Gloeobacter morelensis MG652769]